MIAGCISITSVLYHLFAACFNERLAGFLEDISAAEGEQPCRLLSPSQFGVRAGHNCQRAAFVLQSAVDSTCLTGRRVFAAFFDIASAYDGVRWPDLWASLAALGLS